MNPKIKKTKNQQLRDRKSKSIRFQSGQKKDVLTDKMDEDKRKVKLVKLLETGSDDGLAGPSPVISLSHFLEEVSNQWKPVAGHFITQLSSTTENI